MKFNYYTLFFLVFIFQLKAQEKDTIYYNVDWKETIKAKAHFFRPLPLEEKEDLILIKDYYINGNLQMQGWVRKDDQQVYEGKIEWYYKNGNLSIVRNYAQGKFNGKETTFYEDGNLRSEQNYLNNLRVGEAKTYNNDGTIITDGIYEKGQPYEGRFYTQQQGLTFISTYIQGNKEGEEKVYTAKNELIAEGVYVNNEKSDGTFAKPEWNGDEWVIKIVNLSKGKEEGKQRYFSKEENKEIGYYHMKDKQLVGERMSYDKKSQEFYKMFYKDGKAYTGIFIDKEGTIESLKEGVLDGKQVSKDRQGREEIKIFKAGELIEEHYQSFRIEGVTHPKGAYKDGIPYQGYFIKNIKEILVVDYYEKGIKKYQYSPQSIMSNDYEQPLLSTKSIYKKGEIYDGETYEWGKNSLTIRKFNEGKREGLILWVFAMHYGNVITTVKTTSGYIITEGTHPNLRIVSDNENILLMDEDHEISRKEKNIKSLSNVRLLYYLKEGKLEKYEYRMPSFSEQKTTQVDAYQGSILIELYGRLTANDYKADTIFDKLENNIFEEENVSLEFTDDQIISFIQFDEHSNPMEGMLIEEIKNSHTVKVYKEGKLVATKEGINLTSIRAYFEEVFH
ncbi:hypothetical protein GCM10022393_14680 [Aquimarina addita]|uniref:Toxin-antitoxin system YwqK family antitoxin n=1 Tax=Aquimarina addita TaxID=870485 RepID=A0ABP7XGS1_9FLAO